MRLDYVVLAKTEVYVVPTAGGAMAGVSARF